MECHTGGGCMAYRSLGCHRPSVSTTTHPHPHVDVHLVTGVGPDRPRHRGPRTRRRVPRRALRHRARPRGLLRCIAVWRAVAVGRVVGDSV